MKRTIGLVAAEIERDLRPTLKGTREHEIFNVVHDEFVQRLGRQHPVMADGDVLVHVTEAEFTVRCPDCGSFETGSLPVGDEGTPTLTLADVRCGESEATPTETETEPAKEDGDE